MAEQLEKRIKYVILTYIIIALFQSYFQLLLNNYNVGHVLKEIIFIGVNFCRNVLDVSNDPYNYLS